MSRPIAAGLVLLFWACAPLTNVSAQAVDWPNSIAALGDSITRATLANNTAAGLTFGQPQHSWSTGYQPRDGVDSHYERIRSKNPRINGRYLNLAKSGAESRDLPNQARAAVANGADYVVIQMGANDVCATTSAGMTPTSTFLGHYASALDTLKRGLPNATILVTGVVRVKSVYDAGRNDAACQAKWAALRSCPNVLLNGSAQRSEADARNLAYNKGLRALSARYDVHFDDNIAKWRFSKSDLSSVDCFHPSIKGQQAFAKLTFNPRRF